MQQMLQKSKLYTMILIFRFELGLKMLRQNKWLELFQDSFRIPLQRPVFFDLHNYPVKMIK